MPATDPSAPVAFAPVTFVPVAPVWWATNFGGLVVNGIVASRSKSRLTRGIFAAAVVTHVAEAAYAYRVAQREGLGDAAVKWGLQTLGVGFPSLIALHGLVSERASAPRLEG
jgi:hypothetical protein